MEKLKYKSAAARYLARIIRERDWTAEAIRNDTYSGGTDNLYAVRVLSEISPRSGFSERDILFDKAMRELSREVLSVILPRMEAVKVAHDNLLMNLRNPAPGGIQGWPEHLDATALLMDVLGIAEPQSVRGSEVVKPAGTRAKKKTPGPKKQSTAERNAAIRKLAEGGRTHDEIAVLYDISRARVTQIVNDE